MKKRRVDGKSYEYYIKQVLENFAIREVYPSVEYSIYSSTAMVACTTPQISLLACVIRSVHVDGL